MEDGVGGQRRQRWRGGEAAGKSVMLLDLGNKQAEIASSTECHHSELVRELVNDVQRLGPDRSGGAQNADGFHRRPGNCSQFPTP